GCWRNAQYNLALAQRAGSAAL
ncbi:hypothetical protein A2U01_0063891, partial [Trifolium medium]|nr:hypothetical protein [Trifolium medium]